MSAHQIYNRIAVEYRSQRQADPRIARAILAALGDARTIVNVGAGTGSYEPTDRGVIAVEPSPQMISQRSRIAAPVVRASADALPFDDRSFDASLAILTVHHWLNHSAGLSELARVARRRVVVFTWDPSAQTNFWLVRDYFPAIVEIDREIFPTMSEFQVVFGAIAVLPVPIPGNYHFNVVGVKW